MPNNRTLTTPVPAPPIKYVSVERSGDVSSSAREMTLDLRFHGDGPCMYPVPFHLRIANGDCDAVEVNPNPGSIASTLMFTRHAVEDHPELAEAFNALMTAYLTAFATNADADAALLDKLAELHLIPALEAP